MPVILVLNHRKVESHKNRLDILYSWAYRRDQPDHPALLIWHWCPTPGNEIKPQWRAAGVGNHHLMQESPLTLDPSLSFPCCALHGFITNGEWIPA